MKKLLVVVDMQNDFIDGSLGTSEASYILPAVEKKIKDWGGAIACTMDTHYSDYLHTQEGKHLPVTHCKMFTKGWMLNERIAEACERAKIFTKNTFGSVELGKYVLEGGFEYVELIGLCTDICVISNAMLIKAIAPEVQIAVDAFCCAGTNPESHKNALNAMKVCQIGILNEE